ncbi:MAG TPA: DUF1329 domain-containing protein [Nevskiaceae bacterium]|nr:DUF1329 domain-containing protein [Nevskiaceae bacterium]
MKLKLVLTSCVAAVTFCAAQATLAKVPPEKAAELDGPKYTCMGAERAGNGKDIPEYTGKFQGSWPGMKGKSGFEPGPYADEKPLFTISAANMAQYADRLTEGEKALMKKYPDNYKMNVYPSHRDFAEPKWACDATKKNVGTSEIIHNGLGITGVAGGVAFPFPQSGLEAIWNAINPPRVYNEEAICDVADVYANGSIAWGRNHFKVLALTFDPNHRGSFQDKVNSYFYTSYLLPERDKGFTAVGYQPNDFTDDSTQSWQYLPGLRRVRQAPEVGFDYPVPPAGLRTVDDDYGFNGSPERYTWKLVGKKEMYVPYDNFKVNDPAVKYKDLIKPGSVNPEYERYEAHRVWVLEGTLKPGVRHIYSKRLLYVDEDSWLTLMADNYDARGQLWRVALVNFHYSQESGTWHRGATIYHDLTSGAYEAGYLTNEAGEHWWKINQPGMTDAQFKPEAAARGGH